MQNANASDKSSSSSFNQNNTSDRLFLSISLSSIWHNIKASTSPYSARPSNMSDEVTKEYICVLFFFASSENNMKCAYSAAKYYINMFRKKNSATKHFWIYSIRSLCDIDLWHVCMDCDIILFVLLLLFFFLLFFRFVVYEGKRRMKSYFCKRANAVVCIMGRNVQMNSMAAKCVSELKRKMANIFNRTDFFLFTMACHFSSL